MAQKGEWGIQKAIIEWWDWQHHADKDLLVCHQNGSVNYGGFKGKIMQDMGVRPGIPDLQLLMARGQWIGLFVEVKSDDGTLSKVQKIYHGRLIEQGYCVRTCKSLDECIEIIKNYLSGEKNENL